MLYTECCWNANISKTVDALYYRRRPLFQMSDPYNRRRRSINPRTCRAFDNSARVYSPDNVCCCNDVDRRRVAAAQRFFGDGRSGPRHQVHAEQRTNVVGGSFDFRSGGWNGTRRRDVRETKPRHTARPPSQHSDGDLPFSFSARQEAAARRGKNKSQELKNNIYIYVK